MCRAYWDKSTHCQRQPGKSEMKSLSRVQLFATPWTVAYQAPLSMGFSRQECWSGLPFSSPRDLPDPGIELRSPTLQADAARALIFSELVAQLQAWCTHCLIHVLTVQRTLTGLHSPNFFKFSPRSIFKIKKLGGTREGLLAFHS